MVASKIFDTERDGDTLVVSLRTRVSWVDNEIRAELKVLLEKLQQPDVNNVVVDFGHVRSFGSALLQAILKLWNQVNAEGGRFALCNVSHRGREILAVSRLDTLWPICASRTEALETVQGGVEHESIILVVEDNRDDRDLIRMALMKTDVPCQVTMLDDSAEIGDYLLNAGLHRSRDVAQMPTLILLDLKMPKLNGLQVLQTLRAALGPTNWPPVVILTSSDDERDVADAYRLGANSYIRKPVDFARFKETVRRTVRYWLHVNQSLGTVLQSSSIPKSTSL
jgi:two-component system response regulator